MTGDSFLDEYHKITSGKWDELDADARRRWEAALRKASKKAASQAKGEAAVEAALAGHPEAAAFLHELLSDATSLVSEGKELLDQMAASREREAELLRALKSAEAALLGSRSSKLRKGVKEAVQQLYQQGRREGLDLDYPGILKRLKPYRGPESGYPVTVDGDDYVVWCFDGRIYEQSNPPFGRSRPCSRSTITRYLRELRSEE